MINWFKIGGRGIFVYFLEDVWKVNTNFVPLKCRFFLIFIEA